MSVQKAVLIVDDAPVTRHNLRQLFQRTLRLDVNCIEAENGRQAVERVRQARPDLVILDFSMPDMNGLQTARMLKQIDPRIPILMFTVYKNNHLENSALKAGVAAVLAKGEETGRLVNLAQILLKHGGKPRPVQHPSMAEVRKQPRITFEAPVLIRTGSRRLLSARTLDISASGFGAVVAANLQMGERIEVTLDLPERRIQTSAVVRNKSGLRYGFEFFPPEPEISKIVASLASQENTDHN